MASSAAREELIFFNGVNGATGEYGVAPMSITDLASIITGQPWLGNLGELAQKQAPGTFPIQPPNDPARLDQAGWAAIFPTQADPTIKEALGELLQLRQEQAGERFKIYEGANGYRPGETKDAFFKRHKISYGPTDPKQMPYYVLIVASPEAIPFRFQYQLGVMRGVGRIHFDALDDYARYAQSVMLAETGQVKLPRRAGFFGVANPDDRATELSSKYLISSLYQKLRELQPFTRQVGEDDTRRELQLDWQFESFLAEHATKAQLSRLIGGAQTPALLFTASHGMEFPQGDSRQIPHQGALLCQDWPGPSQWRGEIAQDFYFAGDDIGSDANILGLIVCCFACFGAGTPQLDQFAEQAHKDERKVIAPHNFIGGLPKRLLSRGALAVIGHVERTWGYSFLSPGADAQTWTSESMLRSLFRGDPVGWSTEPLRTRYADLASDLAQVLEELEYDPNYISPYDLVQKWTEHNDCRSRVIIGDPAVRIPFVLPDETPTERPALEAQPSAPSLPQVGTQRGAFNDEVADQDQLNFEYYVNAFADLIKSAHTGTPLTIGIFGSWGMGKSFLLEHIERKAQERSSIDGANEAQVHVVRFNAWEYSANEVIWPGLVRKIMQDLEKKIPRNLLNKKFRQRIWRNFTSKLQQERDRFIVLSAAIVVTIGLASLAVWQLGGDFALLWSVPGALGLGGLFGVIKEIRDAISEPLSPWITALFKEDSGYGKPIDYMPKIRKDLEFLGEGLGEARVLVLIDDLDRCEPAKAVEVLQAIKLLLSFEKSKFIVCLGIDARIITRAIEKHYQDLLGPAGASGYEYLDKIVQIPFRIPTPTPDEIRTFISKQMGDPERPPDFVPTGAQTPTPPPTPETPPGSDGTGGTTDTPETQRDEAGPATQFVDKAGGKEDQEEEEPFTYYELEAFQNLARFLRPNPRHIKRLLNVYRLVRSLARSKEQHFILTHPAATIRWLVLCSQWPYTAYMMLRQYGEMLEDEVEGKLTEWPSADPLTYLLEQVQETLLPEKQRKLEHDPDLLRQLLSLEEDRLSWSELRVVRQYTINFNPAVEAELHSGAQDETEETDRGDQEERAKNSSLPAELSQGPVRLADRIRHYVLKELVAPARAAGQSQLVIRAGDIHQALDLKGRMSSVCSALDAAIFHEEAGVRLIKRSGSRWGANAEWVLDL